MATCTAIITYALQLAKVLPSNTAATTEEAADGLVCLQSMYDGWLTGGMFGELEDVYLEEDDTAEEGKRYFVPTGITLTAPTSVYVDADGDTRQPRDMAVYESLTEAGTRAAKIYDRTAWVNLLGLVAGDTAPLSGRDAMGLAACLATRGGLAAMFGAETDDRVERLAARFLKNIIGKQGSSQEPRTADYY